MTGRVLPRYNPVLQRHSWIKTEEHHRRCRWCGLHVHNRPEPYGPRWFQEWDWADRPGQFFDNYAGGTVPKCPGPPEQNEQERAGA